MTPSQTAGIIIMLAVFFGCLLFFCALWIMRRYEDDDIADRIPPSVKRK